jgi:hypothetical protein
VTWPVCWRLELDWPYLAGSGCLRQAAGNVWLPVSPGRNQPTVAIQYIYGIRGGSFRCPELLVYLKFTSGVRHGCRGKCHDKKNHSNTHFELNGKERPAHTQQPVQRQSHGLCIAPIQL